MLLIQISSYILWLFIFYKSPPPPPTPHPQNHLRLTPTARLTNRLWWISDELRHLDGIKSFRKDRKRTHSVASYPPTPPGPWVSGSDSPAVSGASVRCLERQCACVAERRERGCTVLRTGSAGHHRRTALDIPGWWWRGRLDPDREQEQDREHHRGSL